MPTVTFSDAAAALGLRSRSALYRLRNQGLLAAYLRPPASTGGAERLELEPQGLPPLREHVRQRIRPQINNVGRNVHPEAAFWSEYGRFEPDAPPLPNAEFWETVTRIMAGMLGIDARDVAYQLHEAIAAIEAGVRWDQARWDAASVRGLLSDLEDSPGDEDIQRELAKLVGSGELHENLAAEIRAAIGQNPVTERPCPPLPVVVSG